VHVLPQSYRIPSSVHELAEAVVGQIRCRVPKPYRPRDVAGVVGSLDSIDEAVRRAAGALKSGRSAAYLARTQVECSDAVEWALGHRVPFVAHAGNGSRPLQAPKVLEACAAAVSIRARGTCTGAQLVALLDQVTSPPRGCKAAAKRLRPDGLVGRSQAVALKIGDLWARVTSSEGRFDALTGVSDQVRDYLEAVLLEDGSVPERLLEIGTQHWSKGQEWDLVLVDDMLPRPSVESLRGGGVDADDEHRIAYVAITRAKQELYILSKPSRAKGSGPVVGRYPYPVAA
jgi:hypothetical protein